MDDYQQPECETEILTIMEEEENQAEREKKCFKYLLKRALGII